MNLFLAANCPSECVKVISNAATNENDWILAAILCGSGIIAIIAVCVTIYRSMTRKEKSTKRILQELLENDQDIIDLLNRRLEVKDTKSEK